MADNSDVGKEDGASEHVEPVPDKDSTEDTVTDRLPPVPPPPAAYAARRHAAPPILKTPVLLRPPEKFPAVEVIGLIALTALLDYLLYPGAGGLSYAVAIVATPLVVFSIAPAKTRSGGLIALTAIHLLLALRFAWQSGPLCVLVGAYSLIVFAIVTKSGRADVPLLARCSVPTCVIGGVRWIEYACSLRLGKIRALNREVDPNVFRLVGIPVGVAATFALVFFFSNPLLRDVWQWAYDAVAVRLRVLWEAICPSPVRVLFWGGCLWFLASLVRPFLLRADERLPDDEVAPPSMPGKEKLIYRVSLNTLIAVNLLFLMYNAFDAYHLVFRGALPSGLNHSQYARQGAFWLTVALAMSTFVLSQIFRGHVNFYSKLRSVHVLGNVWLAQNGMLAIWVLMRLHMYISYNGLTRMRIVGIYGATLVTIGLILVAVKMHRRKSLAWLIRKQLAAFGLALVLLAVTPLDAAAWALNAELIRTMETPKPAVQLSVQSISPEGLMMLPPLLDHDDPAIARGVAALLGQWYFAKPADNARWTQYQVSHDLCRRVLSKHEGRILALVPDKTWERHLDALARRTRRWI
ncbi:MAG TPA: DUF4173 domain-containing protein [Candidatus Hydrogenedentes bacterium]|nr:DUF4173 domain-containing protein [Candidatus Hydrogenedentota bacterium]HIJ73536.1 DUF4173 domain-containing protein [Candidatus Hydrogenedentota bacterium]